MQNINFEALGTKWIIIIDSKINNTIENKIIETCVKFEKEYSRFNPNSLLSRYNKNNKIKLTQEFSKLINFGEILKKESDGFFNPNLGDKLSELGYGAGTQGLDFGGYGKGWLIDKIAKYLIQNNCHFFLINAGGDIFATKKNNNSPWNVALEHPKKSEVLIGSIKISNQSLCASSPFKRSWNNKGIDHNHLLNGKSGTPIAKQRSVFTLSKNAKTADALATTLNVIPKDKIEKIAQIFNTEYLIFEDNSITKSKNFDCVIFD